MSHRFRIVDPVADRDVVAALHEAAADYIWLERGEAPSPEVVDEFFASVPPDSSLERCEKIGVFAPDLVGLADLAFGYPEPEDAFLGLLMLASSARGRGLGAATLRHVEARARARGAERLLIAVLDENPRGRAFWEREGFSVALANRPVTLGQKNHIATRMEKRL